MTGLVYGREIEQPRTTKGRRGGRGGKKKTTADLFGADFKTRLNTNDAENTTENMKKGGEGVGFVVALFKRKTARHRGDGSARIRNGTNAPRKWNGNRGKKGKRGSRPVMGKRSGVAGRGKKGKKGKEKGERDFLL